MCHILGSRCEKNIQIQGLRLKHLLLLFHFATIHIIIRSNHHMSLDTWGHRSGGPMAERGLDHNTLFCSNMIFHLVYVQRVRNGCRASACKAQMRGKCCDVCDAHK